MSIHLKNKMLNYTQTPPSGVWEFIAFKLNEEDSLLSQNKLAQKLTNFEEAPPVSIWQSIHEKLEEEEKSKSVPLANRLLAYSTPPPSFVWNKIATSINKEEANIIPISNYRKFAAAAAVITIIGCAIWFSINKPAATEPTLAVSTSPTTLQKEITPPVSPSISNIIKNKQENGLPNKMDEKVDKPTNTKNNSPIDFATLEKVNPLATNPFEGDDVEQLKNSTGDIALNIDLIATPSTYMTIIGPDGQSVKISSKFSKQLGFFTERNPDAIENIDVIIKDSKIWRTKIATWKEKFNFSSMSPSISNFMDVLEMSTILDEKIK
jgi:hypothetical protein